MPSGRQARRNGATSFCCRVFFSLSLGLKSLLGEAELALASAFGWGKVLLVVLAPSHRTQGHPFSDTRIVLFLSELCELVHKWQPGRKKVTTKWCLFCCVESLCVLKVFLQVEVEIRNRTKTNLENGSDGTAGGFQKLSLRLRLIHHLVYNISLTGCFVKVVAFMKLLLVEPRCDDSVSLPRSRTR